MSRACAGLSPLERESVRERERERLQLLQEEEEEEENPEFHSFHLQLSLGTELIN